MNERKQTIYIETTIPNFFFDFKNQSSERKVDTVFFWNNSLKDFEPIISLAVIRELSAIPDEESKKELINLIGDIKRVEINEAVIKLAEQYVKEGMIPQRYSADAIHLAVATIHKIDYLLTWNIQHLAHPTRRKLFRDFNISKNFFVTEIVTPKELNYQINQK